MSFRKFFGKPTQSEMIARIAYYDGISKGAAREVFDVLVQEADYLGVDAVHYAARELHEAKQNHRRVSDKWNRVDR